MKAIANAMYDETGVCPRCGNGLIPVLYYSAYRGNTTVRREYPDSFHKVKVTSVQYHDIQPCYAGWCEVCDRKAYEEKQRQFAGKPKPTLLLPIIGGVLLAAGVLLLVIFGGYGAMPAVGFLAALIGFILVCTLPFALSKRKKYTEFQKNGDNAYTPYSAEFLSGYAKGLMNKTKVGNIEYLSIEDVKKMERQ
ncbi:MAG: hypothetical protein J5589_11555 [Firmicutes bacterium]|nr:hypothetical protein [Bacillota bacterium]